MLRTPLAEELTTKPNQAFFWSGVWEEEAGNMAATKGGHTLESFMRSKGISSPDPFNPSNYKWWEDVSRIFAENASGEVRVFVNPLFASKNSVWNRIELPALKNNAKVTKVVEINVDTGKETVIFQR